MAGQALLQRQRARNSLLDYCKAIDIPGKPVTDDAEEWAFLPVETGLAAHHVFMLGIIEQVITGAIPRAMLFMPPGSAKSTYGSVVAPTWAMGKLPGLKIILASYGSDLARKHGRRARQIVKSPQYQDIFGTRISSDTAAADEWALTNGSEYLACGVLSGITGNRAHGFIIDDPIKGRQEADSETIRNRTYDVYQEDIRTRLVPGGWEILIQTRWHEDDIAGRILPEDYNGETGIIHCRDGRDWYVVCLTAKCERDDDPLGREIGEYLWPEWFNEEHFRPFKVNPRTWSALFQQRPQPEQGTYFQRDWFQRYRVGEESAAMHIYGASDYAVTQDGGDNTEHGVIGLDHRGDVWVLDWWYGQTEADQWIEKQLDLINLWKPFCWFGEKGVIKRAIAPFLSRRMLERKAFCRLEWIASVVDKPSRARAFQALASSGRVHFPYGPTGDRILDQCLRFPTGSVDDAVDVLSLFCLALEQAHPAILRVKPDPQTLGDMRINYIERPNAGSYEEFAQHEGAVDRRFWERVGEGGFSRPAEQIPVEMTRWNPQPSRQGGKPYSDVDGR